MLFRQNYCRKSQKGVYLHRVKSQKGVDMKDQVPLSQTIFSNAMVGKRWSPPQ